MIQIITHGKHTKYMTIYFFDWNILEVLRKLGRNNNVRTFLNIWTHIVEMHRNPHTTCNNKSLLMQIHNIIQTMLNYKILRWRHWFSTFRTIGWCNGFVYGLSTIYASFAISYTYHLSIYRITDCNYLWL